jgi:hypothetical protein
MDDVLANLGTAAELIGDAADILSDLRCDAWADAGGVGAPAKSPRIDRLYAMASALDAIITHLEEERPV